MKVSTEMRGRPGKCIACRQKLSIPGLDDLPPDTKEIHLADHPEYLRNAFSAKKAAPAPTPPMNAPLDVLPRLQRICSFEHTLHRQLRSLDALPDEDKNRSEKEVLLGYRSLVNTAHTALNEQLQKKRHETTELLSVLQEKLAKTTLAFRTGEMDYPDYAGSAFELRNRRETLIRRQRNLDAWLDTTDPFQAGGLVEVDFNDIPTEHPELELAERKAVDETLLVQYSNQYRKALRRKDLAKREWQEWRSMEKDGVLRGDTKEDCRDEGKAALTRARTMVAFCRERLEQVNEDAEDDLKAIEAHRKIIEQQHADGDITGDDLQQTEMELARGKSALSKVGKQVEQALKAKDPKDVPAPPEELIPDIIQKRTITMDIAVAWGAIVLLVLAMILPFSLGLGQRYGNFVTSQSLSLTFLVIAALTAGATMIQKLEHRGISYTLLWLAGTLTGAVILFSLFQQSTPLGGILRTDAFWLLRPGLLAALLASLFLGIAAWQTLFAHRLLRLLPIMTTCILLTGVLGLFTNGFGVNRPKPVLADEIEQYLASSPASLFDITVTLENQGRQSLWLGKTLREAPVQAIVRLERNNDGQWEDWSIPSAITVADNDWQDTQYQEAFPAVQLRTGEQARLRYELPEGDYRLLLYSGRAARPREEKRLRLAPPAPPEAPAMPAIEIPTARETPPERTFIIATVTLRGSMVADVTKPKFMVDVTLPTGETETKNILLNDTVIEPWKALEYNPTMSTLTLTDGKRMRILKTGEALELD